MEQKEIHMKAKGSRCKSFLNYKGFTKIQIKLSGALIPRAAVLLTEALTPYAQFSLYPTWLFFLIIAPTRLRQGRDRMSLTRLRQHPPRLFTGSEKVSRESLSECVCLAV